MVSATSLRSDRKGMVLATLCFIHCVAGPLLLSFAGLASLMRVSEKIEPIFILSSLAVGSATLIPAFRKRHRRASCLVLFFCGMLCLGVLRHMEWRMLPETIVAGTGAALIAGAHALNLKYSSACNCCELDRAKTQT